MCVKGTFITRGWKRNNDEKYVTRNGKPNRK
jgi:hypothetical protein